MNNGVHTQREAPRRREFSSASPYPPLPPKRQKTSIKDWRTISPGSLYSAPKNMIFFGSLACPVLKAKLASLGLLIYFRDEKTSEERLRPRWGCGRIFPKKALFLGRRDVCGPPLALHEIKLFVLSRWPPPSFTFSWPCLKSK